jgi:cytochrome aa3-600 menaquinol oxidase subunit 2
VARAAPRWATPPAAALLAGCGPQYVLLHPAGPVGRRELGLMLLAGVAMAAVIGFVFVLLAIAAIRFRDRDGQRAPYVPDWHESRTLELIWFVIPALLLAVIAVPTIRQTYALSRVPPGSDPLVVDVTSLTWKWLFEYPGQNVATVNYLEIPTGRPILFELTADSPMNTFWVPQLGGMEYTMPGEVLPLWLQADQAGTYWGHSGNFSGLDFEAMFFTVQAVPPAQFDTWVRGVRASTPAMTEQDYQRLLSFGTAGAQTFSAYPADTFPAAMHGFGLTGGQYVPAEGGYQAMGMPVGGGSTPPAVAAAGAGTPH